MGGWGGVGERELRGEERGWGGNRDVWGDGVGVGRGRGRGRGDGEGIGMYGGTGCDGRRPYLDHVTVALLSALHNPVSARLHVRPLVRDTSVRLTSSPTHRDQVTPRARHRSPGARISKTTSHLNKHISSKIF